VEPANARMRLRHLALSAALAAGAAAQSNHTTSSFRLTVGLPYAQAAPLFGAIAEQKWAPDWKPHFVYPSPPADQEGAVFQVEHGSHSSIWMTTIFDLAAGHIQYVYVLDGLLVTRIDIRLRAEAASETDVRVTYERTALDPAAEEHLKHLAEGDSRAGAEWQAQLDVYAAKVKSTVE
jgi:hypothetical protein